MQGTLHDLSDCVLSIMTAGGAFTVDGIRVSCDRFLSNLRLRKRAVDRGSCSYFFIHCWVLRDLRKANTIVTEALAERNQYLVKKSFPCVDYCLRVDIHSK